MGFCVLCITSEIGVNRFGVRLYVALFSSGTVHHTPAHELVSIADGSKGHSHNVYKLHIIIKERATIVHVCVTLQHTVIKLCIVGAHNRAGVVLGRDGRKVVCDFLERLDGYRVEHESVTIKLALVLHERIARDKLKTERGVSDFRNEGVVTVEDVALGIADNPCNVKSKASVRDGFNVEDSENLTHGVLLRGRAGTLCPRLLSNIIQESQTYATENRHIPLTAFFLPFTAVKIVVTSIIS